MNENKKQPENSEQNAQKNGFDEKNPNEVIEAEFEEPRTEELGDEELDDDEIKGKHVFRAIEALLDSNENLLRIVENAKKHGETAKTEHLKFQRSARYIIRKFSNLGALTGGAAALPSIIPGFGKLYSLFGGSFVDTVCTLKYEVEMTLCLCALFGYDITQNRERKLAFLLASSAIHDTYSPKGNKIRAFLDVADVAMWEYSSRQMTKSILKILGQVILMFTTKRLVRFVPLVNVAVGASVNKVLTYHAGMKCTDALFDRKASASARVKD